jgi:hypothetical protein
MGWNDLLSEEWPWPRIWASPEAPIEKQRYVARMCDRIWRRFDENKSMPYGLEFRGSSFTLTGHQDLTDGATGYTCATFVLGAMRSGGIELVDEASWPVREDLLQEQLKAIKQITDKRGEPELFERLASEASAKPKRFLPQEVVSACTVPDLPASFEEASRNTTCIQALLDSAHDQPDLGDGQAPE